MTTNRTDVRALIAATEIISEPLNINGIDWPIRKPSQAMVAAFMKRFPDASEVLAELIFANGVEAELKASEASDKEKAKAAENVDRVLASATEHYVKLMMERGAAFCGAWLNTCLGGAPDPALEQDLVNLPDDTVIPLWDAVTHVCPEGLEPFFDAMAQGAGIPRLEATETAPEEAEPAPEPEEKPKPKRAASKRRST